MQFLKKHYVPFKLAPSKLAFLKLTPSKTAIEPDGSSALHFCKEAREKLMLKIIQFDKTK